MRYIKVMWLMNSLTPDFRTIADCRILYSKDGLHPGYNVQSVVESRNHFITNFEVTNANTDQNLLSVMGEKVKEELGMDVVRVIADKGYESRADIEKCVMNGIIPDVGFKYDKEERVFMLDHEEAEISEGQRSSRRPEDIQACLHAGVLPKCYEETNIEVEVQRLSEMYTSSRFARKRWSIHLEPLSGMTEHITSCAEGRKKWPPKVR